MMVMTLWMVRVQIADRGSSTLCIRLKREISCDYLANSGVRGLAGARGAFSSCVLFDVFSVSGGIRRTGAMATSKWNACQEVTSRCLVAIR